MDIIINRTNSWIAKLKGEGRTDLVERMINEYDRNSNPPMVNFSKTNEQELWWNCINCGLRYECSIWNRTRPTTKERYPKQKENCPKCKKRKKSTIESLLDDSLSKIYTLSYIPLIFGKEINQKWRNRDRIEPDFILEDYKIVIEYDSHTTHKSDEQIKRDIEKSNIMINSGYFVIRCRDTKLKSLKDKINKQNMYSELLFEDIQRKIVHYPQIIDHLIPQIKEQVNYFVK